MKITEAMKILRAAEDEAGGKPHLNVSATLHDSPTLGTYASYEVWNERLNTHTHGDSVEQACNAMLDLIAGTTPQDVDDAVGSVNKEVTP
jgi:hypothetical protein